MANSIEGAPKEEQVIPRERREESEREASYEISHSKGGVQLTEKKDEERIEQALLELNALPDDRIIEKKDYYPITADTVRKVDFTTMKDIFEELRRKSGVTHGAFFISAEGVVVKKNENGGSYNFLRKKIELGAGFIRPPQEPKIKDLRNDVLSTLIHEETHASGKQNFPKNSLVYITKLFISLLTNESVGRFGYEHTGSRKWLQFFFFNEGVTDKIAEEVYAEYLKRTGDAAYFSDHLEPAFSEHYLGSRVMITAFTEIVAKAVGIPSHTVWGSIIQGYMSGLDLSDSELKKMFDEIFYQDFIKSIDMSMFHLYEKELPIPELVSLAEERALSDEAQMKIRRAFLKFNNDLKRLNAQY